MKIAISTRDVTSLVTDCTWSGDENQAARKLEVSLLQNAADPNLPVINCECGQTVYFFDDANNLVFRGNIYDIEASRKECIKKIIAFDNIFVINKSKISRKFDNLKAEEIATSICNEVGIMPGSFAKTDVAISFISHSETAYQAINKAYENAGKNTGKKYICMMDNDKLCVIEKGQSCNFVADSSFNMTDSVYKASIENLVNAVRVVDSQGNYKDFISDSDSARRYSMFIDTYQEDPKKNTAEEAKSLLKKPDYTGQLSALGDFRAKTGYSITVRDKNLQGEFIIKSDTHEFFNNQHLMRLSLGLQGDRE